MDVLELLVDDHADLERLFGRVEGAPLSSRQALLDELVAALDAHLLVEEQILHVETAARCDAATVRGARTATRAAEAILADLLGLETTVPGFRDQLVALRDRFARVVADEEALFTSICDQIGDDVLADTGEAAGRRLEELRGRARAVRGARGAGRLAG